MKFNIKELKEDFQKFLNESSDFKMIDVEDLKDIVNNEKLDVDLDNVLSIKIQKVPRYGDDTAYTELVDVKFNNKVKDEYVYNLLDSNIHELFPLSSWYTDSEDFYGN